MLLGPRSIPACAGKPPNDSTRANLCRVHPRVCGEARRLHGLEQIGLGPSPRVRGSRGYALPAPVAVGSIPACAGKPRSASTTPSRAAVHPRVCGEATPSITPVAMNSGPSPRVRGSRQIAGVDGAARGSIPACAGKPGTARRTSGARWVHPRVCGEALWMSVWSARCTGPSPRVRGSPRFACCLLCCDGSIPACAGKPYTARRRATRARVHPRVCGEAAALDVWPAAVLGPSPRVRGSHHGAVDERQVVGSIPACAGKPSKD